MRWVVLVLLLAGCSITWTGGPMASFRQDDYECKRDGAQFRNPTNRGLQAVADDLNVRKMYIQCMEARGYSR